METLPQKKNDGSWGPSHRWALAYVRAHARSPQPRAAWEAYSALLTYMKHKDWGATFKVGQKRVSSECGIPLSTLKEGIRQLYDMRMLVTWADYGQKGRKVNTYRLVTRRDQFGELWEHDALIDTWEECGCAICRDLLVVFTTENDKAGIPAPSVKPVVPAGVEPVVPAGSVSQGFLSQVQITSTTPTKDEEPNRLPPPPNPTPEEAPPRSAPNLEGSHTGGPIDSGAQVANETSLDPVRIQLLRVGEILGWPEVEDRRQYQQDTIEAGAEAWHKFAATSHNVQPILGVVEHELEIRAKLSWPDDELWPVLREQCEAFDRIGLHKPLAALLEHADWTPV